jgi:hypothetical protein
MARPSHGSLTRLSRKVWVRALRADWDAAVLDGRLPAERSCGSWTELGRQLMGISPSVRAGDDDRVQGFLGVVREGRDPRALVRRVPVSEFPEWAKHSGPASESPQTRIASRKRSGPLVHGERRQSEDYYEVEIDVVARASTILAGTEMWETAFLWPLMQPSLPPLEFVREGIQSSLLELAMCRPTLEEVCSVLPDAKRQALATMPHSALARRYQKSLLPLVEAQSAQALSLLAALCIEAYIVDNDVLLEIHQDAACEAFSRLLSHPFMSDVREDFEREVLYKVLGNSWSEPDLCRASNVKNSMMTVEEWSSMRRADVFWASPRRTPLGHEETD